ncbi:hypothetical protein BDQ17DRAFT_1385205 [Cyathus striatus]|nr:hypothetical protein BDQ17DRAFT_1385205 [Cyathus striatus]
MLSTSYKVQKHESALASFLSLLKNLQELYVQSLTFIVFPSRQLNKAILALKSCLLKNPIQSLHVDDVFTFPMDILHLLPLVRLSLKDVKVSDHFPQPELKYVPHSLPQSLRSLKIHAYVGQTAVRSWIADKELPGRGTITSLTIPSMDFGVGKRVLLLYANTLTALTVEGIDGYGEQLDLSLLPELRTLDLNIDSRESHPDSSWVLWLGSVVRTVDASRFTEGHLKVRVFNDTTEVQYDTLKPEVEQFEAFFWNAPSLFVYSDSDDSPFDYEDDEDEIEIFDTEELEDDEFEEDDYEEDEEEDEYE